MKRVVLFICTCGLLMLLSTETLRGMMPKSYLAEGRRPQQQPGPGQLLVTSTPSSLKIYVQKHKQLPKTNLTRTGNIEEKSVGSTPHVLDLEPGYYTVAVERSFNPEDPDIPKAPRGCINNFSFSGSTVFWDCFKCNFYPATDKQFRDEIDPYKRDGNFGICFYASDKAASPIKYYRLYAIEKGTEGVKLDAKFEKAGQK